MSGYYWRDFDGSIPEDALPGGKDINNKPIYIGQALSGNLLIPAKIYSTGSTAFYELGGKEHEVKDNVMILCTQHPEQFKWIPTDNMRLKLLNDVYVVKGGFEPGVSTYIGRVHHCGEILVGKALADMSFNEGCHFTHNGKAQRFSAFEVLTFQQTEERDETDDIIDCVFKKDFTK